jgi:hypothetical protein
MDHARLTKKMVNSGITVTTNKITVVRWSAL